MIVLLLLLLYIAVPVLGTLGYIANAVWIFHHFAGALSTEMLVALVGLFTPLGPLHGLYVLF
jgi:hypothetical protein